MSVLARLANDPSADDEGRTLKVVTVNQDQPEAGRAGCSRRCSR
jgi:hypothetical protein